MNFLSCLSLVVLLLLCIYNYTGGQKFGIKFFLTVFKSFFFFMAVFIWSEIQYK